LPENDFTPGPTERKYIVDIAGELPIILMEIEPASGNIMKTYIYAHSEVLAQHDGPHTAAKYFYLHDRLGCVRQIINTSGLVQKYYTYEPFGQSIESGRTLADPFRFTGQFYDEEIGEYYLRARQYNPAIARFTARDPVFGEFEEPLTLHKYLYCSNEPVNRMDPRGLWDDGLRYYLAHNLGMSNAYTFSDQELERALRAENLWNNKNRPLWHGHSDFGYLRGDFDYARLDNQWWTGPTEPASIALWGIGSGVGTDLHFRPLQGASGAEFMLGLALRAADPRRFEVAMHMGQDYFSHRGKGYGVLTHAMALHEPDNPYSSLTDPGRTLDSAYLEAQRWTKTMEEMWYLFQDVDTWLNLP
jgi:RHS repeat-associated protein